MANTIGKLRLGASLCLMATAILSGVASLPAVPHIEDIVSSVSSRPFRSLADLNAYADAILDMASLHISKSFSAETRRYRRDLDLTSMKVKGADALFPLPALPSSRNASALRVIAAHDSDYWIVGSSDFLTVLQVSKVDDSMDRLVEFQLPNDFSEVDKISGYILGHRLWIAASPSSGTSVHIIMVNLQTYAVDDPQIIPAEGVVGALHMFEAADELFLVVGAKDAQELSTSAKSRLYRLHVEYFDRHDELAFRTKNVNDISGFSDRGNYYLVFGMSYSEGSQVYKFDPFVQTMNLIQQLPDSNVYKVLHYLEHQENEHYVVTMNDGALPKLYWWKSEQLLLWQVLESDPLLPSGSSVNAFGFRNLETIILISNGARISVYTDDITAHFSLDFVLDTDCVSIDNLFVVEVGGNLVLTFICRDHFDEKKLEARRILTEEIALELPESPTVGILHCLEVLHKELEERQPLISYFESVLENDDIMVTNRNQTWLGPITFSKGFSAESRTMFQRTVTAKEDARTETFAEFSEKTSNLTDAMESLVSAASGVLSHSGDQVIQGPVGATSIFADNFVANVANLAEVNGLGLLNMEDTVMMVGVNQTVASDISFHTLGVDTLSTQSDSSPFSLNGLYTHQFMQRRAHSQSVTGVHNYDALHVSSVSASSDYVLVNGVKTSSLALRNSSVVFLEAKTLPELAVVAGMEVDVVNDIAVEDLVSRLVMTDVTAPQHLWGSYTLEDVRVEGNVDVDSINGVDVKELNQSAVKTFGDFTLSGDVAYSVGLTVEGSATSHTVNGVRWSDIIRVSSEDVVGNFHFLNASVSTAIHGEAVNGLDFSKDIILISVDQIIKGRVTFEERVRVSGSDGVLMSEGATVNAVDPSELREIDTDLSLLMNGGFVLASPLTVSGNVVTSSIYDLTMEDIDSRYWRKSTNQTITGSPHFRSASFQSFVNAAAINNRQMEDFLASTGFQNVTGSYVFQAPVLFAGDVDMAESKTIGGVDLSALRGEVIYLGGEQVVEGLVVTDGNVVVNVDLAITGRLNGWDLTSDLVRLDRTVPHTGNLTFTERTQAVLVTVVDADVSVRSLNGRSVEASTADVVLRNETATVAGPLAFSGAVTVNQLHVSGTVDGVDVDDLATRGLKKNSSEPQLLSGEVIVSMKTHFNQAPNLNLVNNKSWSDHLSKIVLTDYNGTIYGTKRFVRPVSVSGEFNADSIDGISVAELAPRILTKRGEQNVVSKYTFESGIMAKNLDAPKVDGVNTSRLLLVDQDASIDGEIIFNQDVSMWNVRSKSGILDGCNILELNSSVLRKGSKVDILVPTELFKLVAKQEVNSINRILTGSSQKIDAAHFLESLILKSSDQILSREATFFSTVDVEDLRVETVNGVGVQQLYEETVKYDEDALIKCKVQFTQKLVTEDLSVNNNVYNVTENGLRLNALDLSLLSSQTVLATNKSYLITGDKTFLYGFSAGNLDVAESLGDTFVKDLVVVSKHEEAAGDVVFTLPITLSGDLQVTQLLDGIQLTQTLEDRFTTDANGTLPSPCTFEELRVQGDLLVDEINDVKLSNVVVKSGKRRQYIFGQKVLNGGLQVDGKIDAVVINGLDVLELNRSIVRRDKPATLNKSLTMENLVHYEAGLTIRGKVNGFKVPELDASVSAIRANVEAEEILVLDVKAVMTDVETINNNLTCGLFEKMSFGEQIGLHHVDFAGKMRYGQSGENEYFLSVMDCGLVCTCDTSSALYQITEDGKLKQSDKVSHQAVFFFESDKIQGATLEHECVGEIGSSRFKVKGRDTKVFTEDSLGLVADVASFTSIHDGLNKTYVVTAGRKTDETNSNETTLISALRLEDEKMVKVWSLKTQNSAATVDMNMVNGRWYMLVANSVSGTNPSDPYTATSHLYEWIPHTEKFLLQGEFMGDHVTSAIFLTSTYPVGEHFFTLAQLKAADFSSSEDNVKYSTKVLVFKFDEYTSKFKPYESLASYGVVAQEYLNIGDDLYLFLLSANSQILDIYEYRTAEGILNSVRDKSTQIRVNTGIHGYPIKLGRVRITIFSDWTTRFRLYQQMTVCSRPIDLQKINNGHETLLLVSCDVPKAIMTFRLNNKGFIYG